MQKIALYTFIYLSFWTVCFVYKASVHKALTSVLRMCCKCSKERWRWHKHTFLSNNTALIAVHFRDLVRLRSHQQRTVLEFTWTVPQTTRFKRTRVRFVGAPEVGRQRSHHPNEPNSDVNRTRVRTKSASVKAPLDLFANIIDKRLLRMTTVVAMSAKICIESYLNGFPRCTHLEHMHFHYMASGPKKKVLHFFQIQIWILHWFKHIAFFWTCVQKN